MTIKHLRNLGSHERIAGVFSIFTYLLFGLAVVQAAPRANQIDFWNDSEEQSEMEINYTVWEDILEKYLVTDHESKVNRFNYEMVKQGDKLALAEFIDYLQKMDPRQLNKQNQKAFWLNLFNAGMVQQILEKQPKSSVKEMGGRLWRKKRFYITMQDMSFDDIEHGVLRPIFKDPRIHFSLAAGTVGSARLIKTAFTGDNVDNLLEENTKEFLTHNRGVSQDQGKPVLSQIFKWYKQDFGANFNDIKSFIMRYANEPIASVLSESKRASYQYDWALNRP